MLSKALQDAPPPPRRTAGSGAGKAVVLPPTFSVSTSTSVSASTEKAVPQASPEDSFNFALYAAKAFGYATLIVTAGAVGSVWGVKTYMGVKDVRYQLCSCSPSPHPFNQTQEFADRMRVLVREKMPVLSSRIHRPPAEEDHTATIWNDPTTAKTPHIVASEGTGQTEWAWSDAEKRLTAAFERDGFSGWAQAAMQELEAEGRAERQKRGHE